MAVDAGAADVYACDESKSMSIVSCKVLTAHGRRARVKVIESNSSDLTVGGGGELKSRVNLVVTETVDCGKNGE